MVLLGGGGKPGRHSPKANLTACSSAFILSVLILPKAGLARRVFGIVVT
jgi:hypothetical protein